jgi:hypothetical protein
MAQHEKVHPFFDRLTADEQRRFLAAFLPMPEGPVLRRGASARAIARAAVVWAKLQGLQMGEYPTPPTFADWMIWQHRQQGETPDTLAASGSPVARYLNGTTEGSRKVEVIRRVRKVKVFCDQASPWWLQTAKLHVKVRDGIKSGKAAAYLQRDKRGTTARPTPQ